MANHDTFEGRIRALEVARGVFETQQERFASDVESEKGTRARLNATLDQKLDKLDDRMRGAELKLAFYGGGLLLLQIAIPIAIKLFWK